MRNILIVDPRPDDYTDFITAMARMNTACHFAPTAEEALRVAQILRPAAWLINVCLPDMSGHDLLGEIKSQRSNENIWLIANAYRAVDEIRARAGGAAVFLCKPIRGMPLSVACNSDARCTRSGLDMVPAGKPWTHETVQILLK